MKVTYIYHSGFLVETEQCYYVFDYYQGELPELDVEKPIIVFASHAHPDHYNKKIFTLLKDCGMKHVTAVLSKDISSRKYPDGDVDARRVTWNQTYGLPCETTLYTFHSTDAGVAFLVVGGEGIIYHAGDFNDWVWEGEPEQDNRQMTGSYRHEIQNLAGILADDLRGAEVDVAFLPMDPRQEERYADGILYFLKKIKVKEVYPMHFWRQPQIIEKFCTEHPEYRDAINRQPFFGAEEGNE